MNPSEIYLNDWARIFAGDVPGAFYGELVFRSAYVFILLILSMRLLGKRMAGQISRNDMAALVSLAAAIGVPVVAADRGLLPSTIIALIVILITRGSARLNFRNKKMETITIGDVSTLVEDGVINYSELTRSKLARERLMAQLRAEHIFHLGEVKRLYMESSGDFSLIRELEVKPGLLSLPSKDSDYVNRVVEFTDIDICVICGCPVNDVEIGIQKRCPNCRSDKFTKAVQRKLSNADANEE